ncbi:hypothetical protein HID58_067365, partial [Brassica napus]
EAARFDALLLYAKATLTQATVNVSTAEHIQASFQCTMVATLRLSDSPVSIRFNSGVSVTMMSVFDSHAVSFHKQLEGYKVDPRVVVPTCINLKLIGGRLFLNATPGTHFYFDKESESGEGSI